MSKKTDNHTLAAKLDLRRHFLRKYHAGRPPRVIDCCQGSGKLWGQLRREFTLASYWGMDLKPKPGRLKIDSARVLCQAGWAADVVDVDSYGSPWEHWLALLPRVTGPLSVFLTLGQVRMPGRFFVSPLGLRATGLIFSGRCPPSLLASSSVSAHVTAVMLAQPLRHGLRVVEAAEAPAGANARYFGLRLEPASTTSASA